MKKLKAVALLGIMSMMLSACGETNQSNIEISSISDSTAENSSVDNADVSTESATEAVDDSTVANTDNSSASIDESSASNTDTDEVADSENASTDASAYVELSTDTSILDGEESYKEFLEGTAKVKYRGTGDASTYMILSDVLEVGTSYTLDEIAEKLDASIEDMDITYDGNPEVGLIDCGSDGKNELLVKLNFGGVAGDSLYMIIKEIDGELVICYNGDAGARYYIEVKENGVIEAAGSGGASVHYYDYSFVDANGDYIYYYGSEENIAPYDIYYYKDGEFESLNLDTSDGQNFEVYSVWFESNYQKRTKVYYTIYMLDENYEDITQDSDYTESNTYYKQLTDAGLTVITPDEIDELLKKRAEEIGYPAQNGKILTDNREDNSYAQSYIDLINSIEQDEPMKYNYSLIYLDEDDVPELLVDNTGYLLNVYTYRDGTVLEPMDNCAYGVGGCVYYEYAPYKNSIRTFGHDMENYYNNLYTIKDNELISTYYIKCYYESEDVEYGNNTEEELSDDELKSRFEEFNSYEYVDMTGEYSAEEIIGMLEAL